MPKLSTRITGIMPSGKDGWEVHFAALQRKQAGEDILMLAVGDHDFDTPEGTAEAGIAALKNGHHHCIQLAGLPPLRAGWAKLSTGCTGVETGGDGIIVAAGGHGARFGACQAPL